VDSFFISLASINKNHAFTNQFYIEQNRCKTCNIAQFLFFGDELSEGTNSPGKNYPRAKSGAYHPGTNYPGTNYPRAHWVQLEQHNRLHLELGGCLTKGLSNICTNWTFNGPTQFLTPSQLDLLRIKNQSLSRTSAHLYHPGQPRVSLPSRPTWGSTSHRQSTHFYYVDWWSDVLLHMMCRGFENTTFSYSRHICDLNRIWFWNLLLNWLEWRPSAIWIPLFSPKEYLRLISPVAAVK
jgi:hypothetical protein